MKNKEYWNRRYLMDKALIINDVERYLMEYQEKLYGKAAKEIEAEIEKLYQSFADQEHITLAEARRKLSSASAAAVDYENLVQYAIDTNAKLKSQRDTLPGDMVAAIEREHQKYEEQLNTYRLKGSLTRLESIQLQIDKTLLDLYDENQLNIYHYLKEEYGYSYYKGIFNTQQCIGFGKDFTRLNTAAIDKAILHQYSKNYFSETLYAHRKHFSQDLKENLVTGMIRGENLDKMAKRVSSRMEVAYSDAKRLVRTETAYIYEDATMKSYQECGIEQYEYLATLDKKTSAACRKLDGKVFKVADAMPGKNYPPMHPNCRSTTVCHFDTDKVTKRVALNGKEAYEVPSNMNYRQWSKKYLGDAKDSEFVKEMKRKADQALDELADLKKPLTLSEVTYADQIREIIEGSKSKEAKLIGKYYEDIKIINLNPRAGASYSVAKQGIRVSMEKAIKDKRGKFTPLFHEIGHRIDSLTGSPSQGRKFMKALEDDRDGLIEALMVTGKCDIIDNAYKYLQNGATGAYNKSYSEYDLHSISDLLGGLTDNRSMAGYGHRPSYWKAKGTIGAEAYAHFFEAELGDNEKKRLALQQTFPKAYEEYRRMLHE